MSDGLEGFNFPGGTNGIANQKDYKNPRYKSWYVWLLPLLVIYAYN